MNTTIEKKRPNSMTDQEIIQGLIAWNNLVTKEFLFDTCRPPLCEKLLET